MKLFKREKPKEYSKIAVDDTRALLWVITIGCLLLAAYCIHEQFLGSIPWLAGMVSAAWAAHGTVVSFYLNMAKSDHSEGGITYESAKAANFGVENYTPESQYTYIDENPKI